MVEGRPLDDGELVERSLQGDVSAFASLVRRHQGIAHRVAYVIVHDETESEDVVQEAFVKAHRALPGFRAGSSFRTWFLTIVGNEARNRRRSAGRRVGLALRLAGDRRLEGEAPSSEAVVLDSEGRYELLKALARLKPDDQLVLSCRYLLEMSEAETAAALGCPAGTVKSRSSRALARLRSLLEGGAR
jgi:RNA polymerase sigma factor (sigma-70 family)